MFWYQKFINFIYFLTSYILNSSFINPNLEIQTAPQVAESSPSSLTERLNEAKMLVFRKDEVLLLSKQIIFYIHFIYIYRQKTKTQLLVMIFSDIFLGISDIVLKNFLELAGSRFAGCFVCGPRFFPGASAYFKVVVWWIFAFYSCVPWID